MMADCRKYYMDWVGEKEWLSTVFIWKWYFTPGFAILGRLILDLNSTQGQIHEIASMSALQCHFPDKIGLSNYEIFLINVDFLMPM